MVVAGLDSNRGKVYIALVNSEQGYRQLMGKNGEPFRSSVVPIENRKATIVFRDIPFGEYALNVFHDENGNGKLDTRIFGIPKEAYGFSNNARGRFGPPGWEKAKFTFDNRSLRVEVQAK